MKVRTYQTHPAADEFPLMTGSAFDNLVEGIRKCGQLDAAWIWNGLLLDGRNRALACERLGIELKTREFTGDEAAALDLIMSENVERRHLSKGALALIGGAMDERYRAITRARQAENMRATNAKLGRGHETIVAQIAQSSSPEEKANLARSASQAGIPRGTKLREHIGKQLQIAPAYVGMGKSVLNANPRLAELVKSERINIQVAAKIAALPQEQQDARITEIESTKKGARPRAATTEEHRAAADPPAAPVDNDPILRGIAALLIASKTMTRPASLPQIVLLRVEQLALFVPTMNTVTGWGYVLRGWLTWNRPGDLGQELWPILSPAKNAIPRERLPTEPVTWQYHKGSIPNDHLDVLNQLQGR